MTNKTERKLPKDAAETLLALLTTSTKTQAAAKLGIARNSLYARIEKYGLQEEIDKLPQEALSVLKQGSIKAAENYIEKIDHRDARISIEASNQILNRVGISGEQKQQTNIQNNVVIVPSDLVNKYGTSSGPTEDNPIE